VEERVRHRDFAQPEVRQRQARNRIPHARGPDE
jgi:hypothetical protein